MCVCVCVCVCVRGGCVRGGGEMCVCVVGAGGGCVCVGEGRRIHVDTHSHRSFIRSAATIAEVELHAVGNPSWCGG